MKNPLIPAGIEPATFRFIAQHVNHCATAVPKHDKVLLCLTDTSLYIYISRELLATLEEEYFVELGSWLVHCAV